MNTDFYYVPIRSFKFEYAISLSVYKNQKICAIFNIPTISDDHKPSSRAILYISMTRFRFWRKNFGTKKHLNLAYGARRKACGVILTLSSNIIQTTIS